MVNKNPNTKKCTFICKNINKCYLQKCEKCHIYSKRTWSLLCLECHECNNEADIPAPFDTDHFPSLFTCFLFIESQIGSLKFNCRVSVSNGNFDEKFKMHVS